MKRLKNKRIFEEYWLKHYVNEEIGFCSLCGNTGIIDTIETARTPLGFKKVKEHYVGRKNYCICPNGRAMNLEDK